MIADAAVPGAAWTSFGAAAVLLVVVVALTVERARMKRRLSDVERSGALMETDLADARAEISALRDCLRDPGSAPETITGSPAEPGTPGASVG